MRFDYVANSLCGNIGEGATSRLSAHAIGLDSPRSPCPRCRRTNKEKQMKNYIRLMGAALCFGIFVLPIATSSAQNKGAKLQAISQQLDLTPQQKAKVLPILADEAPKVEAVKNNSSLSGMQKMQQLRAIHQQTDPQMKAILSPAQYQKLQTIRQQAVREAMQKRRGGRLISCALRSQNARDISTADLRYSVSAGQDRTLPFRSSH